MQEAARKDVERAFGVLQITWQILSHPSKMWSKDTMIAIMRCCLILHNMIVEERRINGRSIAVPEPEDLNVGPAIAGFDQVVVLDPPLATTETKAEFMHFVTDRERRNRFIQDLIEHLWENHHDQMNFA